MSDGGNLTLSIFCLLLSDHRSDANTALQIKINSADLRPQADDSTVCTSLLLTCVMASDDSTVCTSLLLTCVMASDDSTVCTSLLLTCVMASDDSTVCTSLLLTCVMASDDSTVCTSLLLTCVMASDARLLLWFALGVMYHHALRVLGLSKSCRIPQDVAEL